MPEPTKATDPTTSTEEGKNSAGATAEGAGSQTAKTDDAKVTFTPEQQEKLNSLIADAKREAKSAAKKEFETLKEKEDRERQEQTDEEQRKFEKLASDRKVELNDLKPKHEAQAQELEQYKAKVAELAAAELKALPDEVKDIAPAVYADDKSLTNPLDVLAWLPKGKALAAKLEGAPAKSGAGPDPKAKGAPGNGKADEEARASQRKMYRHF